MCVYIYIYIYIKEKRKVKIIVIIIIIMILIIIIIIIIIIITINKKRRLKLFYFDNYALTMTLLHRKFVPQTFGFQEIRDTLYSHLELIFYLLQNKLSYHKGKSQ